MKKSMRVIGLILAILFLLGGGAGLIAAIVGGAA